VAGPAPKRRRPATARDVEVVASGLGPRAELLGALALVLADPAVA
jgi:hypothetical protein